MELFFLGGETGRFFFGLAPRPKEECGLPQRLPYATTLGNIYTVGSKVCYKCNNGFANVGGNISCALCTGTGNWSTVEFSVSLLQSHHLLLVSMCSALIVG